MYLSRLTLPQGHPETHRLLGSLDVLQGSIMRAFPDNAGRVLFRIEPDLRRASHTVILVQSEDEPLWSKAPMPSGANTEHKQVEATFVAGERLRFRLRANPTVKKRRDGMMNGNRVPIVREEEQRAWLERKGATGGFKPDGIVIIDEGTITDCKPSGTVVTFRSVRFEGVLQVTQPDIFARTVRAGIGSGKAFGFGLLSLARA